MHIAIDAVGNKQAGVKTILLDSLRAAIDNPQVSRISVFTSPLEARDFQLPASEKVEEISQSSAENFILRLLWYERGLPKALETLRPDVLLCIHSMGESPPAIPHATFVQRPLVYSAETRRLVKWNQRYRMPVIRAAIGRSCRTARRVFVHTPTEKRSVSFLFAVPHDKIQIILPPPRPLSRPAEPAVELEQMRDVPEGRRLLFVGQLFAHKNVGAVAAALPDLRRKFPDLTLFVSGPPSHYLQTGPGMVYLGALPERALREAYELATLLIMPSLHETIGLPMLEAMDASTPVVAVDRPYAHDVCEDAAIFFEPQSKSDLVDKVSQVLGDAPLRADLSERGLRLVKKRALERPYERLIESTLEIAETRK